MADNAKNFRHQPIHAQNLFVEHGSVTDIFGEAFNIFTKYVKVFDLYFLASPSSKDSKLLHGARVLYQYIDNDDDGLPDNKEVYAALVETKATMVMFKNEKELDRHDKFFEKAQYLNIQDLQSNEVHPGSTDPTKFDASLEECFHLVCTGYDIVYHDVLGFNYGTPLACCCDNARGGYFRKVPKRYPTSAWFTYYDKTCDYNSMIYEYAYWAMTSILGAQEYRRKYIDHEWKLCTREEVMQQDPQIYHLLTDTEFCFPKILPVEIVNESKVDEENEKESSNDHSAASYCTCL